VFRARLRAHLLGLVLGRLRLVGGLLRRLAVAAALLVQVQVVGRAPRPVREHLEGANHAQEVLGVAAFVGVRQQRLPAVGLADRCKFGGAHDAQHVVVPAAVARGYAAALLGRRRLSR